jgi:hypothetical protein
VSDKHHKKAAFGPSGGGRIYTRDSNPPPMPEERVTTGSEPAEGTVSEFRQPTWREVLEELAHFSGQPEVWRIAELAKRARAALGVEPGHDEQTEAARAEFERVVDFLDEQGVWFTQGCEGDAIYHGGHSMEALADAFEERFKPSAPGGDDGH